MEDIKSNYITVKQALELFPCFTEGSLRYIIYNHRNNGAHVFIRRVGRKVIILKGELENWIKERGING